MVLFLFSCNQENKIEQVERAAYYWKSNGDYSGIYTQGMKDNNINTLYIKYFEVDYNDAQGNFPFAKTSLGNYSTEELKDVKIIPTIFIKNEIFCIKIRSNFE